MAIKQGEIDLYGVLENLESMPKQKAFISSKFKNAAYVGGQGAGKSIALCTSAILNALAEPNGFSLIGRLNIPALETSTLMTFLELVPETEGEWAETKRTFTFHNGHQIVFKHLDISDPKVVGHIKSMNLSAAYVDEATEISEEVYFLLIGRLRRKTAKRHIIRLSSNPNGHDWVWKHFFDPDRRKTLQESNDGVTVSSMENPFLPEDYVENMKNTYPADWADRFIYGSFSDLSDLVYKELKEQTHSWDPVKEHIVFGGQNPPEHWPVIIGMDIGSDIDPWAIPIVAVAPNGMLFQYDEVYGSSLLIAEIAEELKMKIGNRKIDGIAYDYANRQAALELGEHGIHGEPAIKEVRPGLFKMAQYIHVDPRLEHPFSRTEGSPRYFISQSCKNTWREMTAYKWAKDRSGNATGEPSHDNSHSPDGVRYLVHTFRPLPEKAHLPKKWENEKLDMASRMYWMEEAKKEDRMVKFKPRSKTPQTIQEWQRESQRPNRRFQRPKNCLFRRF